MVEEMFLWTYLLFFWLKLPVWKLAIFNCTIYFNRLQLLQFSVFDPPLTVNFDHFSGRKRGVYMKILQKVSSWSHSTNKPTFLTHLWSLSALKALFMWPMMIFCFSRVGFLVSFCWKKTLTKTSRTFFPHRGFFGTFSMSFRILLRFQRYQRCIVSNLF